MRHIIEPPGTAPLLAELHMHSAFSGDANKRGRYPEVLVEMAERYTRLNAMAITDHDDVLSSLIARDYARKKGYKLQIVTGSEISSADGHIQALFINQNIPAGLSAVETVRLIHIMGGLAVAPHPMYERIGASSLGKNRLMQVACHSDPAVNWDGLEVFNAGAQDFNRGFPNEEAFRLYMDYPGKFGAALGGTDGHSSMIGRAVTTYAHDLKQSIQNGRTGVAVLDREETGLYLQKLGETLGEKFRFDSLSARQRLQKHLRSRVQSPIRLIGIMAESGQNIDTRFLTPDELDQMKHKSPEKRPGWVSSRLALKLAYCGVTGLGSDFLPYLNVKNDIRGGNSGFISGPPFVSINPDLYYSLSHSGPAGIAGVSLDPVGVDMETLSPRRPGKESTLKLIATENELEAEFESMSIEEKIARIWTLKEAVIKGTQIGISLNDLLIRLERESANRYGATANFRGAEHSFWKSKCFRYGDTFASIASAGVLPDDIEIEWHRLPE